MKATHGLAFVELRRLAHKMGGEYQKKMEDALASARMEGTEANTSGTLHIKSGKPMNMFQASAWSAAFVQFFYGDCAPNLDRPMRIENSLNTLRIAKNSSIAWNQTPMTHSSLKAATEHHHNLDGTPQSSWPSSQIPSGR